MIIVSMTTTSARIAGLDANLRRILTGNRPPDRLVLNLGLGPSQLGCQGIKEIPQELRDLAEAHKQLEFRHTKNLGPGTKLLPTLREQWDNEDQIIVTADDDVLYPPYWLNRLLHYARQFPDALLCYTARAIRPTKPYEDWPLIRRNRTQRVTRPHWNYLPRGHDGVLYRPRFFQKRVFDITQMLRRCPSNDDIWFTARRRVKTPVRVVPCLKQFPYEPRGEPLYARNRTANDDMIREMQSDLKSLCAVEAELAPTVPEDDPGLH